jgi:ABC-type dipeptide/oligopeptide/nickel transport system permease subunit
VANVALPKFLASSQVAVRPLARRERGRRSWQRPPLIILVCVAWLAVFSFIAIAAPAIAPHDPLAQNLKARNLPPAWQSGGNWDHPFGTDAIGYDVYSRTLYGARPALQIGAAAAIISLLIGTTLGLVAGHFRGLTDAVIMLLVDAQLSTPFIVIAIAAVAAFGRSMILLIILAGISSWMGFARTVRARVLSLSGHEFVDASRAIGASNPRILVRHLLPNLASIVIVLVTIQIRTMILFEASMSFLGLGVPPPAPSWGSMISGGRDYLLTAWWISVLPAVALVGTVLAASLIGDWLRDALDPTLRGKR